MRDLKLLFYGFLAGLVVYFLFLDGKSWTAKEVVGGAAQAFRWASDQLREKDNFPQPPPAPPKERGLGLLLE